MIYYTHNMIFRLPIIEGIIHLAHVRQGDTCYDYASKRESNLKDRIPFWRAKALCHARPHTRLRSVTRLTGFLPVSAKAGAGTFPLSDSGQTRALHPLNPLAGSVAPVGHRHIPEICETQNYLAGTGRGLSAAGGDSIVGTFTTSAGTANPVAHVRTRGKAPRTVQTSAQAVSLTREKHRGQIPAYEVGRVGLKERVHKLVFGNINGVGIGSAVASTLGTAGRTDSIRQKAAPTLNQGAVRPSGLLYVHEAGSP